MPLSPASKPQVDKLAGPMLTPNGTSSFFSTGSPTVLFVSAGTEREGGPGTGCVSSSNSPTPSPHPPPPPALADPLGIRLTVPSAPSLAPGTRQNPLPAWVTHPLARRTLQREGGERAVKCGGESSGSPTPLGLDGRDPRGVACGIRPQAFGAAGGMGVALSAGMGRSRASGLLGQGGGRGMEAAQSWRTEPHSFPSGMGLSDF